MFGNYDTLGGDSSGASASFAATRAPESEERASADQNPVIGSQSSGQQPDFLRRQSGLCRRRYTERVLGECQHFEPETPAAEAPAAADESTLRPRAKN